MYIAKYMLFSQPSFNILIIGLRRQAYQMLKNKRSANLIEYKIPNED